MDPNRNRGPLFDHLDEIEKRCLNGDLSLSEIFEIFGSDGHYVLITFLIIPFLQPVPLLGLSTPFGLLIAVVAVLAHLNRPPSIPKRWSQRKISGAVILKIAEVSEKVFEKIFKILHPRMNFLFQRPFQLLNTIVFVVNALLLALPLPIPFSNAFPAWTIALLALAFLEEDGVFVILSYVLSVICLIYFVMIAKGVETSMNFFPL